MRRVSGIVLLVCGVLAGCSDANPVTAPDPNSADGPRKTVTTTDLSGVPTEYRYYPYFVSRETNLGSDWGSAVAIMKFRANNAKQTLLLKLYLDGHLIDQSPTAVSRFSLPLPPLTTQTLVTRQSIPVQGDCGHTLVAQATHEIWNTYLGLGGKLWEWGRQEQSTTRQKSQDNCLVDDVIEPASDVGEGGGGGNPDDCSQCVEEPAGDAVQWCKVRYWYDVNTGEIVDWYVMYCW